MTGNDLLLLRGRDVRALLAGREVSVMAAVRRAYEAHARGDSTLPHSTFLRFPDAPRNRIIALPAYLGGEAPVSGVKWIASFPGNLDSGLARASAVVVLNSPVTGRPYAFMEGAQVSAERTAASAALAATTLRPAESLDRAGLVGCGVIGAAIARHLLTVCPRLTGFVLHDTNPTTAARLTEQLRSWAPGVKVDVASDARAVLAAAPVVTLTTTALEPYLPDLSDCPAGALILHVSLRDLTPDAILGAENVVDDPDHVCRANTSVHLAEQRVGNRGFIRCTLADVFLGRAPARPDDHRVTVFSPFGLGVLDLAVGQLVYDQARATATGHVIEDFLE